MSEKNTQQDFMEADPIARRNAMLVVCLSVVFASILLYTINALEGPLQYWLEDNIQSLISHPWIIFLASLILVAPLLWGALYLFKYGSAIVKHNQIPAPGYGVVRRMAVTRGEAAATKGRLVQLAAIFILISAMLIPILLTLLFLWIGTLQ